ncbi:MAG: hypothetical protein U5K75_03405 [Ahrensia sp.]|nr:hypothetical protein [Ahrensia sp.]
MAEVEIDNLVLKTSPADNDSLYDNISFAADTLIVLFQLKWWILALMALITISSAIAPSIAWITKEVLADVSVISKEALIAILIAWGPLYFLIKGSNFVLGAIEKVIDKLIDVRLLIILQRLYLDRRTDEVHGRDTSQVLFGARVANKGFDVIYKRAWKIITTLVSVFVWQLALGPEWIALMVLSVIIPSIFVWMLGPRVQELSKTILDRHEDIASSTERRKRGLFEEAQRGWMNSSIRFEFFKWFLNEGASALLWTNLGLLVFASYFFGFGLVPETVELPVAAAFLVNLRLVAKPLMSISKEYSKWREAYPAMLTVFRGGKTE